ncbi:AIPR family protein [Curtobacterium flaccumfaciens pv. flaccumfaciens]|uniref:AIPR family protein n=1 Tax=Curtobacterium flaccumfaciens TaxID=2035 RepID=UPI001ADBDC2F|nr:AIPR family protein [Curtobacterium flaccumfaciens]MBO9046057.1 AIPR family protein [Curtobacterium flaccumfaciens pv. flaccumfaciens]MCS5495404.1 AIPR family protein [Curtobacterium flaccumfaciens pv. flaccumfaciens]QTR90788.1 AIPR family protein [Curtobacterium flaccumfaciens pv. flaccumfaciens]QVG66108.1 AIPR family protein [Curtobacterium flaccumfaciens pv. flaccumfaciens]
MTDQTPDQAVLESAFLEFKQQDFPDATLGDAFEHFCGQELTKEFGLSDNEVKKGVIGGDKDGGVDGFYVVVNETEVLDIDSPLVVGDAKAVKSLPRNFVVDVVVIQAKWTDSWQSDPLTRMRDTLERTLPSNADVAALELTLNSALIERTGVFRDLYRNTLTKGPRYRFHIYYATKGPDENLVDNHDAHAKSDALQESVKKLLPGNAIIEVRMLGARAMCDVLSSTPSTTSTLRFTGPFVRDEKSFIGLVSLRDYLAFVRQDEGEELRPGIFESNVRDFAGSKVTVNAAIRTTLTSETGPTFWWLNNGVTVLCDVAEDAPPLSISLTNPLVVNGLQTSNVIHEAERDGLIPEARLDQGLMVRIIASSDDDVRDGVIASTNRQNSIQPTQLHATEQQHRDIESYFATQGWYYERRKHQYRGAGKPASRIVKMTDLSQYMIAIALGRPDDARARPQSVLGDKRLYPKIFGADVDRKTYLTAVRLMSQVDSFLSSDDAKGVFDDFTNARFYVAVGYVMKTLKAYTPAKIRWENNHHRIPAKANQARLADVLATLQKTYQDYQEANPNATRDQVFKGKALKDLFFAALKP